MDSIFEPQAVFQASLISCYNLEVILKPMPFYERDFLYPYDDRWVLFWKLCIFRSESH